MFCGGGNFNCSDVASGCICSGCMEGEACNYNASATIDNGSCYYEKLTCIRVVRSMSHSVVLERGFLGLITL